MTLIAIIVLYILIGLFLSRVFLKFIKNRDRNIDDEHKFFATINVVCWIFTAPVYIVYQLVNMMSEYFMKDK